MDTEQETEIASIAGNIRRIEALAMYGKMCATGEGRHVKLWSLASAAGDLLCSFAATKTFVTSLFLNDAMLVTGSSAGIVKMWSLANLLRAGAPDSKNRKVHSIQI